jgi:hypothetical protein
MPAVLRGKVMPVLGEIAMSLGNWDWLLAASPNLNDLNLNASSLNQHLQQYLTNDPANAQAQAQRWPLPMSITINFTEAKIKLQADEAMRKLPWRIARHIQSLAFWHDEPQLRFEIVFDNGHKLEFTDVDRFPSDADIAQIALECP